MNTKLVDTAQRKEITIGVTDYVKDGILYQGAPTSVVMVESYSDLAGLAGHYEPGTVAYTAGYKAMWQLAADGTWVDMMEVEGDES